eukprot:NODE_19489_length_841_cov_2.578431.p2 GENE.NODE_19489_length_841_cov_2.578431~~NODE_19489_length_841_cov_2.578431.p2  ORF type:complete len:62 (-),score=3.97 NODE_19489_length_841_cov_2.578431:160-345(-)
MGMLVVAHQGREKGGSLQELLVLPSELRCSTPLWCRTCDGDTAAIGESGVAAVTVVRLPQG